MVDERFPKLRFAALWSWGMVLQLLWWFPWHLRVIKTGLDNSFRYAQNDLFVQGAQFASQALVQYGPYGFLKNDLYHPDTVGLLLAVRLLLFVVFAALAARASTRLGLGAVRAAIWIALLVAVVRYGEPYFLTLGLLGFVVFWAAGSDEERIMWSPVALVLALSSLMQFTYGLANVGLIAAMVLTVVIQWAGESPIARSRRRWAPLVEAAVWPALFGLGLVFLWVAAGQDMGSLFEFTTTRLQLTTGYSGSHALPGPIWQVIAFDTAAVVFLIVYAATEVRRSGASAVPTVLVLGLLLVLAHKHSFVRHDAAHASYGAFEGLCVVLVFAPLMLRRVDGVVPPPSRTTSVLATVLLTLASALMITYDQEHWYGARFLRHLDPVAAAKNVRLAVTDPGFVEFRHQRAMKRIRKAEPLPRLSGSVDVYPWEMSLAYAYEFQLVSRPTLQSYQASEPWLAEINARHVRWPDGPDHLLFRVATVDHRFPSMDDGPSWPNILSGYRLRWMGRRHLVLDRLRQPRRLVWREPTAHELEFGERLAVDHRRDRMLWVRVEMEGTAAGRMASTALRAPILYLRVELANGTERWYRIIPGMARAGFLLSPLVDDAAGFASLLDGSWPGRLNRMRVRSLSLASEFGESWFYTPGIRVELQEFHIE